LTTFFVWVVVLCTTLVLWTAVVRCVTVLVLVAAIAGDPARATTGRMKAVAAIRRLNEVITSRCSGEV
jgi:hypothetical protein